MNEKETKTLQDPIQISYVSMDRLLLDGENPRFAGLSKDSSEDDILLRLQKEMHLDELIDSFEKNGFYNTEPLLVIKAKQKDKFIVIEGNRRLAAIKTLFSSGKKISASLRNQLSESIPIAIYPNRESLWTYLGFRHINGPQEWDSYSKAVYALKVHKDFKISIDKIAERIGDRHQTVVKMCNGLRILDQAEQNGDFKADEIDLNRFYFSHLYTILTYDNTRKFLGISGKKKEILKENPVPKNNLDNLKQLLEFLFGNKDGTKGPVIKSQSPDLRYLDAVIGNKLAIKYLKENSQEYASLENALAYTDSEDYKLEDFIFKALNNLRKASGYLSRYKGNEDIYKEMEEILQVADDIMERMKAKRNK
ncbi:MAG: ParB/Srx family N-terminal domain-containing protein [Candidatus Parcubacteria bacterium]|nr:ParB/Srx family N-terminal domain-containing protein [Candidatus Parcubacteria bacterium]